MSRRKRYYFEITPFVYNLYKKHDKYVSCKELSAIIKEGLGDLMKNERVDSINKTIAKSVYDVKQVDKLIEKKIKQMKKKEKKKEEREKKEREEKEKKEKENEEEEKEVFTQKVDWNDEELQRDLPSDSSDWEEYFDAFLKKRFGKKNKTN